MDSERVLVNQTVIVEGERIAAMGRGLPVPPLEASGLSRLRALSAATRGPGAFIQRTQGGVPFGMIAPGHRADLILSKEEPLATLSTLRAPLGIMAKGKWRDSAALKAITDANGK